MDESEADVLGYMTFPPQHRAKLHSTTLRQLLQQAALAGASSWLRPLERLNGEIKRRTEVVEILPPRATPPCFAGRGPWPAPPNEAAVTRLVGAILLEQNDEWSVQRARYMTLETITALSDDPLVNLPLAPA